MVSIYLEADLCRVPFLLEHKSRWHCKLRDGINSGGDCGYCCSAKWCNGLQLTQSVGSLYSHQPAVTSPSESGLQIGNWLRSHWIHCIDRLGGCDYLSRYSKQLEMRSRKREQVKESGRLRVTRLIEDAS